MNNALTVTNPTAPAVTVNHAALWSREQIDVIKETVAKGATDAQLQMFLALAARYGLDPFAKEIWCVNMGGGMTIMASRDGYLKAAQRDLDFKGLKSFVVRQGDHFEIDPANDTVSHKFGAQRGAILGAWAMACHAKRPPVIVWAEFAEYNKGNQVWKTYPSAMIQKVAEVMALKRQFGINGLVTQEEIGTPDEGSYTAGPTLDTVTNTRTGEVTPTAEKPLTPAGLTANQIKRLYAIAKQHGLNEGNLKALMASEFEVESVKDLNRDQYDALCDVLIPNFNTDANVTEAEFTEVPAPETLPF